jgi:hypothetical protein
MGRRSRAVKHRREHPASPRLRTLREDLIWGLGLGVFGTAASFGIGLMRGLRNSARAGLNAEMPTWEIIAAMSLAGIVAGALIGLLRPLGKSRMGSMVIGIVVMVPVAIVSTIVSDGPMSVWSLETWLVSFASSSILGACFGLLLWEPHWEYLRDYRHCRNQDRNRDPDS